MWGAGAGVGINPLRLTPYFKVQEGCSPLDILVGGGAGREAFQTELVLSKLLEAVSFLSSFENTVMQAQRQPCD